MILLSWKNGFRFGFLAAVDAGDAADDAAKGEDALGIGKEDFADAVAAVVPALEQGEMFHGFEGGGGAGWRCV